MLVKEVTEGQLADDGPSTSFQKIRCREGSTGV